MTIDVCSILPAAGTRRRALVVTGGWGRVSDLGSTGSDPSEHLSPDSELSFSAWVQPHWPVLQRFAARLVPTDDRDDLLQNVLERAWHKRHTFDPARGSAQSWLLAITADRARRFRLRARPAGAPLDERRESPAPAANRDTDLVLRSAVALLSDRRRMAVELFYYIGLPIAEVAAVMRCAEGTVKATLSAARAELRATLHHQEAQERSR